MPSAFDIACAKANAPIFRVFADAVEIDGEAGNAIVLPDTDLSLGGGVQLYNGAHLMFLATDFPDAAVNSEVAYGEVSYIITELDDIDSAGVRKARMAIA